MSFHICIGLHLRRHESTKEREISQLSQSMSVNENTGVKIWVNFDKKYPDKIGFNHIPVK